MFLFYDITDELIEYQYTFNSIQFKLIFISKLRENRVQTMLFKELPLNKVFYIRVRKKGKKRVWRHHLEAEAYVGMPGDRHIPSSITFIKGSGHYW